MTLEVIFSIGNLYNNVLGVIVSIFVLSFHFLNQRDK